MGADGGIGGTYGVMPELFMKIDSCFKEGKLDEAREWQYKVNTIIAALLRLPSLYGGCKAIMRLRGLDIGEPRMPILPIPEDGMAAVEALNDAILGHIEESRK
jgi:N-acetylneuraminate lyase